jgi:uncharacterized protein YjbI with pentapeptide repeats
MKVFISWSGNYGKAFAKLLHAWLPSVLQAVRPYFSPDDIAKGARWSNEISAELDGSQVGIIILTREAIAAPWIMFEAGALSKNVGKSKVVPILLDLELSDISGPLMQFQCAKFEQSDVRRILRMLNSELGDRSLTDDVLESVFSMWWPSLKQDFAQLSRNPNKADHAAQLADRDLLKEILALTRSIAERQSGPRPSPAPRNRSREGILHKLTGTLTVSAVKKRLTAGGNLVGANLMDLNFSSVDLTGANLRGANLVGANLTEAKLVNANLDGANLERAILDGADVSGATMSRINLWRASILGIKNLEMVSSLDDANFFGVKGREPFAEFLARHQTLDLKNYPSFFQHFRTRGLQEEEIRNVFLWTAHAYPGSTY